MAQNNKGPRKMDPIQAYTAARGYAASRSYLITDEDKAELELLRKEAEEYAEDRGLPKPEYLVRLEPCSASLP